MNFDWRQRISGGIALIALAYFLAHTFSQKAVVATVAPPPVASPTASKPPLDTGATPKPPPESVKKKIPKPQSKPEDKPLPHVSIEQHSSGPNSPNIVTGEITINNAAPKRHLSPEQKEALVAKLVKLPLPKMNILRWPGNDVQGFGNDLVDVFKRLNWPILTDGSALTPEPNGSTGMAVFIKSVETHPAAADVLITELRSMGFKVEAALMPGLATVDEVKVVIGPNE
jgi:hypothetical protein